MWNLCLSNLCYQRFAKSRLTIRSIFEPKWDGWKILIHKQGTHIEAYTRQGYRVTSKFPELEAVRDAIKTDTAIMDCEGVRIRDGRSVFDDFAYRGQLSDSRKVATTASTYPATFMVFDILSTDADHTQKCLMERKARLASIVEPSTVISPAMYTDGIGVELKKRTEERNWEGIVAKRKASCYVPGTRSTNWLKIKNWREIDTVILGYRTQPRFGLIVGLHFPNVDNKPVATVEFGFSPDERAAFLAVVKQIHTVKDKQAQWVEPVLCCRVQYLERTERYNLRIVSFKGFLPGKDPDECVWVN